MLTHSFTPFFRVLITEFFFGFSSFGINQHKSKNYAIGCIITILRDFDNEGVENFADKTAKRKEVCNCFRLEASGPDIFFCRHLKSINRKEIVERKSCKIRPNYIEWGSAAESPQL